MAARAGFSSEGLSGEGQLSKLTWLLGEDSVPQSLMDGRPLFLSGWQLRPPSVLCHVYLPSVVTPFIKAYKLRRQSNLLARQQLHSCTIITKVTSHQLCQVLLVRRSHMSHPHSREEITQSWQRSPGQLWACLSLHAFTIGSVRYRRLGDALGLQKALPILREVDRVNVLPQNISTWFQMQSYSHYLLNEHINLLQMKAVLWKQSLAPLIGCFKFALSNWFGSFVY